MGCFRSVLPRLGPGGVVLAPPTNGSLIPGGTAGGNGTTLGGSSTAPGAPGQAVGHGRSVGAAAEGEVVEGKR